MSTIIVVAVLGGIVWFLGIWPFDRSYRYLPKYADIRSGKDVPPADDKPAP
jgi:hypothetical protein